jgi:hypothetical protein
MTIDCVVFNSRVRCDNKYIVLRMLLINFMVLPDTCTTMATKFCVIHVCALIANYMDNSKKCTILLHIILQLKFYNSDIFRHSSGHIQGVHINCMYKTHVLFKYVRLKLGFGVVRWLEVCRILIVKLYIIILCTFLMLSYINMATQVLIQVLFYFIVLMKNLSEHYILNINPQCSCPLCHTTTIATYKGTPVRLN